MAFIKYLKQQTIPAENRVNDLDNIVQISSVHSKLMKLHYEFFKELMLKKSPLSRAQRERIGIYVSKINRCHYWILHHGAGLRRVLLRKGWSDEQVDKHLKRFLTDYHDAGLSAEEVLMLDYVHKVTTEPASVTAGDTQRLREAGFNDLAIHDICATAAYFAFVNRLADGLGVKPEARFEGQAYFQAGREKELKAPEGL